MKKLVLFAASAAILASCSTQPKYVIQGDIAGVEGTVYLFQRDSVIDSATVNNGKFRFEGVAETPAMRLLVDSPDRRAKKMGIQFILEAGSISVKTDSQDADRIVVSGTPANDAMTGFNATNSAMMKEYRDPATTNERREAIEKEYDEMTEKALADNKDNYFGVVMLQSATYGLSGQELSDKIAEFSPQMQQTKEMADLKTMAAQKIKTDVGQPYINIMQSDADGQIITLTSVIDNKANKYTLVDFWASWCGPCMGEIPHLKQTYDKYHKKGFEIYGVSFDNNKDKWLGAVKDHGMNWIHVSDLNGFDNPAAKDYAVQGIPSNFLIDSEGKIVAKNLRGEDVYKKIEEFLGE